MPWYDDENSVRRAKVATTNSRQSALPDERRAAVVVEHQTVNRQEMLPDARIDPGIVQR